MIEQTILGVIEFAGGIGVTSVVTNGALKVVPATINTAEKVCVGVGVGMASIAADRIIMREFEGYYKDLKRELRKMTKTTKKHYHEHNKKYEKKEEQK